VADNNLVLLTTNIRFHISFRHQLLIENMPQAHENKFHQSSEKNMNRNSHIDKQAKQLKMPPVSQDHKHDQGS